MKKSATLATMSLLLLPIAALAVPVSISWTGEITGYQVSGGGFPSLPLPTTSISGVITYDTSALPTPDAGNPPEIFSASGGDFIHSTINWAGGLFQPFVPGGSASDSLLIVDSDNDEFAVTDTWSFLDPSGEFQRDALMTFSLFGLPDLFTIGAGTASATSVPDPTLLFFGEGGYFDLRVDFLSGDIGGFLATFQVNSFEVAPISVPEPATVLLMLIGLSGLGLVHRRKRWANL
jgi:hypothetical protein